VNAALLKRTTFLAADAERQASFYTAVLHLTRWYDHELSVDHRYPPTGAPHGARAKLVILQSQDPAVGMIGFLQYLDAPLRIIRPGEAGQLRVGDPVLVFNAPDVDEVHERAVRHGATISSAPAVWEVPQREGSGSTRLKMLSFFDPEGHYCEVSTRL
jgi:catechol 2,3-dioxygenase-like lactoylglutathione lyase family enzyme